MHIRSAEPADYGPIIAVVDEWWGGRQMRDMLPKLFFVHFRDTSFVAVEEGEAIAFLVGFCSQAYADEAYIHFVGVHPAHRRRGLGEALYDRFFEAARGRGRTLVRCVTSPVNAGSIAFHRRMGFDIEPGEPGPGGVEVARDYDGRGGDRVLFFRRIG